MDERPRMEGSAQTLVQAPAERIYDLVSNVTRMGDWSPECRGCEWEPGSSSATIGARFRGTNEAGGNEWTTTCEITAADRGREFAFHTLQEDGTSPRTRWRYTFHAEGEATLVTESFEVVAPPPIPEGTPPDVVDGFVRQRRAAVTEAMTTTLDRVKQAAETPT